MSSVNRTDPSIRSTEQLGTTVGSAILPSGVMLPAAGDMQSGTESSGVSGPTDSIALHPIASSSSSSSTHLSIGSSLSASL
ncbi:hypothetical protein BG015_007764, partial [Linnemannia schmuckeri]